MAKEQSFTSSFLLLAVATFLGNVAAEQNEKRDPFRLLDMTREQIDQLTPEDFQKINEDLNEVQSNIRFSMIVLVAFITSFIMCPQVYGFIGAFFAGGNDRRRDRSDAPNNNGEPNTAPQLHR
jgi:hypothetical protein